MDWCEPVFLRYDFEVRPDCAAAFVRLGFPRHADEKIWTCALQFWGASQGEELKDGHIYRVTGSHGLGALIEASNVVRSWLGRLVDRESKSTPFELVFPRFLPTSWYELYSLATELVEFEISQLAVSSTQLSPPAEQTSSKSLDGPSLFHQQFKLAGGKKVTIWVAYPTYLQDRGVWSCAFQPGGLHSSPVQKIFGANGLLAVANAADIIRNSLGEIGSASAGKGVHELTFPAHVPTGYGLELHRQLCDRIDAEINQMNQDEDEQAAIFSEILANLPRSARL